MIVSFGGTKGQHLTIAPDGVHLSDPYGQRKYFYSLRSIVVSYLKAY